MRWPVPGHIGLSTHDERQRADRVAVLAQRVHLGDLLVERTAVELDAERVDRDLRRPCRAGPSSTSPCRARGRARSSGSRSAPRAAFMRASVSLKPSRRRSRQSGPIIASGSARLGTLHVDEMPVVERSRESGRSPSRDRRGSWMRAAHQRFSASHCGSALATAAPVVFSRSSSAQPARATASSQVAARSDARPPISRATTASSSGVDATCAPPFSSGSARRRTKSTLKRNRSSCARVARRRSPRRAGSTSNSRVDETADVRRHRDQQVRQRDRRARRVGRGAIGVPLAPQNGVGGLHFLAKPFVQRGESLGIVQIGKRVTGHAERRRRCGRRRRRRHAHMDVSRRYVEVQRESNRH